MEFVLGFLTGLTFPYIVIIALVLFACFLGLIIDFRSETRRIGSFVTYVLIGIVGFLAYSYCKHIGITLSPMLFGAYALAGLAYFFVEFFIDVRGSKDRITKWIKKSSERFDKYIEHALADNKIYSNRFSSVTLTEEMREACKHLTLDMALDSTNTADQNTMIFNFLREQQIYSRDVSKYGLFTPFFEIRDSKIEPDVNMHTGSIVNLMFLMIILWPMFLLAMIVEDVLINGATYIAELLSRYSKQFIKSYIKDAFKAL